MAWIAGASLVGAGLVLTAVNLAAFRRGGDDDPIFRNGTIVYEANGNIRMVDPDGSNDHRVVGAVNDGINQSCPSYSPDGRSLFYLENNHPRVVSVDGRGRPVGPTARFPVVHEGFLSCGRRSPDGRLLPILGEDSEGQRRLLILSLDDKTAEVMPFQPSADGITWGPESSWLAFVVDEGIAIFDLASRKLETITTSLPPVYLASSANGSVFAFTAPDPDINSAHLFLIDRDGTNERKMTDGEGWESNPQWSPRDHLLSYIDEQCVAFRCQSQIAIYDGRQILALPPARMEEVAADHMSGPLLWAPDGRSILHQAHIELSGLMGGPLVVTPLSGTPRVVTVEFGIVSYDWQPVPER